MAGDWIKMRMDLPEDPAVYRIARLTSLDRLSVVGRLYAFWAWADKHAVDGRVDGGSSADIDDIVSHVGFADAMVKVKWLEVGDEYLAIPKHERHNGESAKERGLKNARQARWRDKKDGQPSTSSSTKASTREEKRREDISVTDVTASDAGATDAELTKAELWSAGKSILEGQGMPKAQCGSFVGKLVKDFGDAVVVEAVRSAVVQRPADAAQYLVALCQQSSGQRKPINKQAALEAQNRQVGEQWAAKREQSHAAV